MSGRERPGRFEGGHDEKGVVGDRGGALILLVAAGAGGYALAGIGRPQARATASPTVSPSPEASPSPSESPALSPSPTPLNCRIAVAGQTAGSGGFVNLPDGSYTVDKTSNVSLNQTGYGGAYGFTYLAAYNKWVPVKRDWIAPDGASFAYTDFDQQSRDLYVAPTRSGSTREVALDRHYEMKAWLPDGVYAAAYETTGQLRGGLTRIDPASGHGFAVADRGNYTVFSDHEALGYDLAPPTGTAPFTADKLLHLDLRTGKVTEWFNAKGLEISPLAIDSSGAAIVQARNDVATEVWRVTAPGGATKLYSGGSTNDGMNLQTPAVTDGERVWFGSNQGLVLYTQADGFKVVAKATGTPAGLCH